MSDQFQLDALVDGEHIEVIKHEDPAELREYAQLAKEAAGATGYRIYKADRKRLKSGELAGGPRPAPRRPSPGVLDSSRQAQLAAEWIQQSGQRVIHVYPLGKTERHASNQFRLVFFSHLLGIKKSWPDKGDRIKAEKLAVKAGYTIVEVDPNDWVYSAELEIAA